MTIGNPPGVNSGDPSQGLLGGPAKRLNGGIMLGFVVFVFCRNLAFILNLNFLFFSHIFIQQLLLTLYRSPRK